MSITDELRECIATAIWQYENGIKTAYIPNDKLLAIADRIDEQHEKAVTAAHSNGITKYGSMVAREYVKLPVDADGVPIRVGDELMFRDYRTPARASYVGLTCEGWVIEDDNLGHEHKPYDCRHVQPDSWQRIIEDAIKNGMYDHDNERIQQKLVERCRRLAGDAE